MFAPARELIWCVFPTKELAIQHAKSLGIEADLITMMDTDEGVQVGYGWYASGHFMGQSAFAQNVARAHSHLLLVQKHNSSIYVLAIRHGIIDPRTDRCLTQERADILLKQLKEEGYQERQHKNVTFRHIYRLRPLSSRRMQQGRQKYFLMLACLLILISIFVWHAHDLVLKPQPALPTQHPAILGYDAVQAWDMCHSLMRDQFTIKKPISLECKAHHFANLSASSTSSSKFLTREAIPSYLRWDGQDLITKTGVLGAIFLHQNNIFITKITITYSIAKGQLVRFHTLKTERTLP